MRAIVNATPLIALAAIGRLHLLQDLFDDVIVPQAVYHEVVVAGADKPDAGTWAAAAHWLSVMRADQEAVLDAMLLGLDAGEMEVLLLARQITPDWVLIDERQARRVAFALGLPVKGTWGVLLAAVLAGLLPIDQALNDLQRLLDQGIRISPRWQAWFRSELGAL
jgi:predicted nucleic acid-binding protein